MVDISYGANKSRTFIRHHFTAFSRRDCKLYNQCSRSAVSAKYRYHEAYDDATVDNHPDQHHLFRNDNGTDATVDGGDKNSQLHSWYIDNNAGCVDGANATDDNELQRCRTDECISWHQFD